MRFSNHCADVCAETEGRECRLRVGRAGGGLRVRAYGSIALFSCRCARGTTRSVVKLRISKGFLKGEVLRETRTVAGNHDGAREACGLASTWTLHTARHPPHKPHRLAASFSRAQVEQPRYVGVKHTCTCLDWKWFSHHSHQLICGLFGPPDKLATLRATVTRVSTVRPLAKELSFTCGKCGNLTVSRYAVPNQRDTHAMASLPYVASLVRHSIPGCSLSKGTNRRITCRFFA
eukprot:4314081-Pyramimonas_sp.AAC.2